MTEEDSLQVNDEAKILENPNTFYQLIIQSNVFVDKTMLLKDLLEDNDNVATVILRPRRWGKTINLQMIKSFLEVEVDEFGKYDYKKKGKNNVLFTGGFCNGDHFKLRGITRELNPLKISSVQSIYGGSFVSRYQGQYPVLYLSLKDLQGDSYERVIEGLKQIISSLYNYHSYLLITLNDYNKKEFQNYLEQKINETMLIGSLYFLCEVLCKYFKNSVVLLIDEYDNTAANLLRESFNESYDSSKRKQYREFSKQVAFLISNMISQAAKNNESVSRTIITGIFNTIPKKVSGLNNLCYYGIKTPQFQQYYGFTLDDIKTLIKQLFKTTENDIQFNNIIQKITSWYNGYKSEEISIYNPWSVMRYLKHVQFLKGVIIEPKAYWNETGTSIILQNILINCQNQDLQMKLANISAQQSVKLNYRNQFQIFDDCDNELDINNEEFISHSLLNSGYLTYDETFSFSVPNHEVYQQFSQISYKYIKYGVCSTLVDKFLEYMIKLDEKNLQQQIQQFTENMLSIFDLPSPQNTKRNTNWLETNYKVMMIAFLSRLTKTHYIVSEALSVFGRPDIIVESKKIDPLYKHLAQGASFCIEIKQTKRKKSESNKQTLIRLQGLAENGIKQIKEKKYFQHLNQQNEVRNVILISIAFCGKEVQIKMEEQILKSYNKDNEWKYIQTMVSNEKPMNSECELPMRNQTLKQLIEQQQDDIQQNNNNLTEQNDDRNLSVLGNQKIQNEQNDTKMNEQIEEIENREYEITQKEQQEEIKEILTKQLMNFGIYQPIVAKEIIDSGFLRDTIKPDDLQDTVTFIGKKLKTKAFSAIQATLKELNQRPSKQSKLQEKNDKKMFQCQQQQE